MKIRSKGVLFALLAAIMWGFLAIVLKFAVTDLRPIDVTWFRFTVAFVILFSYYVIVDRSALRIMLKPPIALIIAAIFLGLNYLGFISGVKYTTPSIAQVFIQIGPLLLALSGFILFKEKTTWLQLTGLALVVGGIVLFYREQLAALGNAHGEYKVGITWVIVGALSWAGYAILQKDLVKRFNPMHLNLVLFGLPALAYLPTVHFSLFATLDLIEWLVIVFLGINTLVAYGSLAIALKYLEANRVSVIITLNPIITFVVMAILGYLEVNWMVKEKFTPITIIGALLVLVGTVMANLFASKKTS
jgi:drug/metabolite transporter (DMT)-like permease